VTDEVEVTVRRHDGRYECILCGAVLDLPTNKKPKVVIAAASGKPMMRTIVHNGTEIHRCPIASPKAAKRRS
jgi:hypothetical protein